ncbi:MAG: hypothetical protein DMF93_06590 [Acidobacteria bacterium]|nr:MAG: hypothetical protein DMF93_06590 [Acidobacteriota bacterium]
MVNDPDVRPLQDQTAILEQSFIDDFLRMRGHDAATIRSLPQAERNALLTQASTYAAAKLAEVESRAHYVHDIHAHGER